MADGLVFVWAGCESCREANLFDSRSAVSQLALIAFLDSHKNCLKRVLIRMTEAEALRATERLTMKKEARGA